MRDNRFDVCALLISPNAAAAQIVAGTPEDKLFQRIIAAADNDEKLRMLEDFEKEFPQSKVLPNVYLLIIDLYRATGDRAKMTEYSEKTLCVDEKNVTAMMVLSRNYALERKNIDRAVMLAEQAVDLLGEMKAQPTPAHFTEAQWKDYMQNTDGSARSILEYARSVKGR